MLSFQHSEVKEQRGLIAKRQVKVERANSRPGGNNKSAGGPRPPRASALTSKGSPRYHTKALMRQTRGVIEATEKDEAREVRGKF